MKYTKLFPEKAQLIKQSLTKLGYRFEELKESSDENFSERVELIFKKEQLTLNFRCSLSITTKSLIIGFSMYDSNLTDKSFSLDYFVNDHGLADKYTFKSIPGSSAEDFFHAFFSELEVAFETYLKDQLSGKVFHDHKNKIMDSFYNNSNMYEKIVEIIDEHHGNNSTFIGWIKWKITRFKMKFGIR